MTDLPPDAAEREQRLQGAIAAYLEAVKEGQAPEREQWLARHPDLADDLRQFLDNHAWALRMGEPLRSEDRSETSPPARVTVRYFGDYELLDEIARGGMGVVYRARQVSLNRVVALKMILAGQLAGTAEVRRFHAEAEAAAHLDHPHIVPIHEVGEHDGQHYFSMKFVEGGSLATRLTASGPPLSAAEAARLVATVGRAVHFAHQRGILHRDLKPANILLDRAGTPLVSDFGLARRVEGEGGQTQSGAVVGTPEYMAPEQARAEKQPTIAVDVWALGAILYECLTGRPPFRAATLFDTIWKVMHEEPVAPRQLAPKVPRDLETICLKCLHKDAGRRYATAEDLVKDLERWQAGEPVRARPVGRLERVAKWARRKPSQAALLMVSVLATLVLVIAGSSFTLRLATEVKRAETAERAAKERADDEATARTKADFQALRAETARHAIQMDVALRACERHDVARAEEVLGAVAAPFQQTWEARYLRGLCRRTALPLRGHRGAVHSVCFSPDGKHLASGGGSKPGEVKVWDALSGKVLLSFVGHPDSVLSVCFSPDGKRIASASQDKTVRVWDATTGKGTLLLQGHTSAVNSVAFSPDGKRLASASADKTVKVWDAVTGKAQRVLTGHTAPIWSVCFSPDGKWVAAASGDIIDSAPSKVKVWDVATGQEGFTLPEYIQGTIDPITSVCFSPDGKRFAVGRGGHMIGQQPGEVKVWDVATGRPTLTLQGHTALISSMCFSADGKRLASASWDQTVKVWDAATGREVLSLQGHTSAVNSVCFSPDGKRLASGSLDKTVKVWDVVIGQQALELKPPTGTLSSVCISPDGRRVASGSYDKTVKVWDVTTGQQALTLKGHAEAVLSVCISPDGTRLASGSMDQTVKVWDMATGQDSLTLRGHTGWVTSVCFSPDGTRLASGSLDKTVKVWDVATGQQALTLTAHTNLVTSVCFRPDGRRLAAASADETVKVWDTRTGQEELTLRRHTDGVSRVAFSPDGKRLALGSIDKTVRVLDAATGQVVLTFQGHRGEVLSVCFSPDGQRLVSGSEDGTVKVWDTATGQEVLTLKRHTRGVNGVCFSPDGQQIASASLEAVQVWEAPNRQE